MEALEAFSLLRRATCLPQQGSGIKEVSDLWLPGISVRTAIGVSFTLKGRCGATAGAGRGDHDYRHWGWR